MKDPIILGLHMQGFHATEPSTALKHTPRPSSPPASFGVRVPSTRCDSGSCKPTVGGGVIGFYQMGGPGYL